MLRWAFLGLVMMVPACSAEEAARPASSVDGGAGDDAGETSRGPRDDGGEASTAADAADAAGAEPFVVAATDTLTITIQGGMPLLCGDGGLTYHHQISTLDFGASSVVRQEWPACVDWGGDAGAPTTRTAVLTSAQRDALLAAANQLQLVPPNPCIPDEIEVILALGHGGATVGTWYVDRLTTCPAGTAPAIEELGYEAFQQQVDALFP